METARWDLVKGDCDRLIEVKITIIKGHNLTTDRLIEGDRLIQVRLQFGTDLIRSISPMSLELI